MMTGGLFCLEADHCPNEKPLQLFKNWSDVISTACGCHYPSKAIMDGLQLVKVRSRHASWKHAIVQPGADDSTGHCICGC